MQLTPQQVNEFFDEGYVLVPDLFGAEDLRVISEAFNRISSAAGKLDSTQMHEGAQFVLSNSKILRVVWCSGMEPDLLQLSTDKRFVEPAAQLLGSPQMDHIISQAHFKHPGDDVMFHWHQDSVHRRYGTDQWVDVNQRGSYVQVILAIDEMNLENGPLRVVPKSCQRGHIPENEMERLRQSISLRDTVPVEMKPGSVLFVHPFTIHGSLPNESNVARRVWINGYASPGANNREYPGCGKGRPLVA